MKHKLLLIAIQLVAFSVVYAQNANGLLFDATNSATRDASAAFEINANTNTVGSPLYGGLLLPRVALTGTTDVTTIAGTEATSLLVYNTAIAGDVTPGFYYWIGPPTNAWQRIISGNSTFPTGSGATNYLARWTSATTLGIGISYDDGTNVGIGLTSPQKKLDVLSTVNDFVTVGANTFGVGQWTGIHFGYREDNSSYRKSAIVFERTDNSGGGGNAAGKIHLLNGPAAGAGSATLADSRLTIGENGNVGIATTAPIFKLHVSSDVTMDGDITAGTSQLSVGGSTTVGKRMLMGYDTNGNGFGFIKAGNYGVAWTALALQPNGGSVGIGTSVPTAQLHTTGTVRFANYPNGILGTDASGNLQTRSVAISGSGIAVTNGDGVFGNPTLNLNYGSLLTAPGGNTPLPTGNFGQFQGHSTYSDFNTDPAYWGWNFVQGTGNAPNATSSQWYREILSLGSEYPGRGVGGYSLELAFPRFNHSTAGIWMRTTEGGGIGAWTRIDAGSNNNTFIWNQNSAAQTANFWISGNAQIGSNFTNLGGRLLTSHDAGWLVDGSAPQMVISSSYTDTRHGFSIGLDLHNDDATTYGTYSPAIMFSRRGASTNYNSAIAGISAQAQGQGGDANWVYGSLVFYTHHQAAYGLSERMRIDQLGNVGIGESNPQARLEVEGISANWNESNPGLGLGSVHLDPGSGSDHFGSAITWGASDASSGDNSQSGIYVRSDGTYGTKMYFGTTDDYGAGAKTRMMIDYNGNVGIGAINPRAKLEVAGSIVQRRYNEVAGSYGIGTYYESAPGLVIAGMEIEHADVGGAYAGNYSNRVHLRTHLYNGGWDRRLTVDYNGYVGIGTTSPSEKLTVKGNFNLLASDDIAQSRRMILKFDKGGDADYVRLTLPENYSGLNGGGVKVKVAWMADHAARSAYQEYVFSYTTHHSNANYLGVSDVSPTVRQKAPLSYGPYEFSSEPNVIFYQDLNGGGVVMEIKGKAGCCSTPILVETEVFGRTISPPTLSHLGTSAPGGMTVLARTINNNADFTNQEISGVNASAGQPVPWNAGATEITMGSFPAVNKIDDNTTNGSAILVVASVTVSGNDLHFANGVGFYVPDGSGGYTFQAQAMAHGVGSFTVGLERRINGGGWTALTSQSAVCAMSIGDYRMQELGVVSQAPGGGISGNMYRFPNSVSISYFDSDATTGNYEYRLVFTPGGYNKNGGSYNITQRNLTAVQIKR